MAMKFGFVTCVQLGLSCMKAIYEVGGKLDLAVTLKDNIARDKSGRIYLDSFCAENAIPLLKVKHVNERVVIDAIKGEEIDWLFIIGWSQIAAPSVLNAPKCGVLGMHPTLLPEGRGRASIPWAILKRLRRTGVTLFKLDSGVDTGPIVSQLEIPLSEDIDATRLYSMVNEAHVELIRQVTPSLVYNKINMREQDSEKATIWPGRTPQDGKIDPSSSIYDAECLVRATTKPYPGAYVLTDEGKIIIWTAKVVERPGKNYCIRFKDGFLECLNWERKNCE